ncbi:spe-9 [Pristionchus pacificus]|uniref:Spe-9 n=1 Tax=Pristionchus pacificus TaxID=54126 RepID=A0A2A6CAY4_PRIPA|nr:spe-9 [Pristionchus pacificus]|eukprot:PDM75344.1 spe-9 [Pristionchus pacificus]
MISRGVVHWLIYLSLLLCYSSSQRSYKFKQSPEEESKWSKFKGKALPKVMKAAKYFTAPPPIDVRTPQSFHKMNVSDSDQSILRNIPEEAQFDPCATSTQLCMNGGECTNDRGKFYCNCKDKYYGKRCELVANKAACAAHACKNGGVCYTTPDSQKVIDRDKLTDLNADIALYKTCRETPGTSGDECERKKLTQMEPTKERFDQISQTVFYRCQCQNGFQGPLCDHTREERLCDEDFCMDHGYPILVDGKCSCACEPEYTGEHCESLLPCSAFPCHNEGICKDEYDSTAGTFTAKCVCPDMTGQAAEGSMRIEGEHCEILKIGDELNSVDPCGNLPQFFKDMNEFGDSNSVVQGLAPNQRDFTTLGNAVSKAICGLNRLCKIQDKNFCSNLDGVCGIVAGPVQLLKDGTTHLFPLPRCACPNLRFGKMCEEVLENICQVTNHERNRGITIESRCTSFANGRCSVNTNNERFCECQPDYVGERCEIRAPCARRPCGENNDENCIPIPIELSVPGEQSYRCICDVGDELMDNKCVYHGEGKCKGDTNPCNHGKCVSCPDPSGIEESICNDEEQKRGFRLAIPLFIFTHSFSGPCAAHLCLNDGICKVNKEHTYDCSCPPGTSGDYCETIEDYCEFVGNRKCGNTGTCSNSNETIRGFMCSCQWEYRGVDCEVQVGKLAGFYQMFDEYYMYSYPITALIICVVFLVLADFLCGNDRKEKKKKKKKGDQTSVSKTNQTSKNSKTSKSEKRSKGANDSAPPAAEIPNVVVASTPTSPALAAAPLPPEAVQPVVAASPPVGIVPV